MLNKYHIYPEILKITYCVCFFLLQEKMTVPEKGGKEIFFTCHSGQTFVPVSLPWYQDTRYTHKERNKRIISVTTRLNIIDLPQIYVQYCWSKRLCNNFISHKIAKLKKIVHGKKTGFTYFTGSDTVCL